MTYRTSAHYYKIRKISENYMGEVFGLTIAREIAIEFSGVLLFPKIEDNKIIFESGAKIQGEKKHDEQIATTQIVLA